MNTKPSPEKATPAKNAVARPDIGRTVIGNNGINVTVYCELFDLKTLQCCLGLAVRQENSAIRTQLTASRAASFVPLDRFIQAGFQPGIVCQRSTCVSFVKQGS